MKFTRRIGCPLAVAAGVALALCLGPAVMSAQQTVADASPLPVPPPPAAATVNLAGVRPAVTPDATILSLEISGDFTYTPASSGERLLFVDLPRVRTLQSSDSQLLSGSPLVSSYRVVPYMRGDEPGVRLEVLLKQAAAASYERSPAGLSVRLATAATASAAKPAAPSPSPVAEPVVAPPPVNAPAPARGRAIENITFARDEELTRVLIHSTVPVEYRAFTLSNPPRLVLDIPSAENRAGREFAVGVPPVKSVRIGQFSHKPPVSRVVVDLEENAPYRVVAKGNILEVELKTEEARSRPAPRLPSSEPRPVVADASAAPDVPATTQIASAQPILPPASATPRAPERPAPAPAPVEAPPLAPMNVAMAMAPQQPQQNPPVQQPGPNPPPLMNPPQAGPQQPAPAQQMAPGTGAGPVQAAEPRYTGEPISVNLKDVDLRDFFRLIHEISGLNIVLDPNVSGRVTLVLEDVPWDQALDIVLRNNGLAKQLEGNVLRIARQDTLRKEEEDRLALETARQQAAERVTVMRPLNFARATQMMNTVAKFRSPRGEIIADERTNTLIITDIPQMIPTFDEIIRQLDRRTLQVEIEARVVAASRNFTREIGAQFGFGTTAAGGRTLFTGNLVGENRSPVRLTGFPEPFTVPPGNLPLFSNFPAAGANAGFGIFHRSPNAMIDTLISFAETKGIGKLLSRPRIITQNNQQGNVKQGVRIPVQTTINNTISVQFFDATLSLTVRPQITNEGSIFLDVTVENTTIDPGIARINGVPALDTQSATTQVLVNDGGTVVFGGVLQNTNNITVQQVPVLGSIPIIGNLFKRTGINTTTNELLFFVTPKIV